MSEEIEIEKKYLLKEMPWRKIESAGVPYTQGYFNSEFVEIRIRNDSDRCTMAAKSLEMNSRHEWQTEITKQAFYELWPLTEGRRIYKWCYRLKEKGILYEFDSFDGYLNGLVTMEIEFHSMEEFNSFKLPDWCKDAIDVTEDPRYKNKHLSMHGIPK